MPAFRNPKCVCFVLKKGKWWCIENCKKVEGRQFCSRLLRWWHEKGLVDSAVFLLCNCLVFSSGIHVAGAVDLEMLPCQHRKSLERKIWHNGVYFSRSVKKYLKPFCISVNERLWSRGFQECLCRSVSASSSLASLQMYISDDIVGDGYGTTKSCTSRTS